MAVAKAWHADTGRVTVEDAANTVVWTWDDDGCPAVAFVKAMYQYAIMASDEELADFASRVATVGQEDFGWPTADAVAALG